MKKILVLITNILLVITVFSQKGYFQQQVNFNIKTELNLSNKSISCFETVTYINNSPDTLYFIYFHIWANGYKNNKTALAKNMALSGDGNLYFKHKKIGGYIDSLDFKSNNKKLRWEYDKKHIDICKVFLDKPLLPNEQIEITTPFYVKIPDDISRLGQKDSTFQITQWYPKPAVYDQEGWHPMPYQNQGEFYSEYGNYDVFITVPKQVVVAATGNLQTKSEIKWINELVFTKQKGSELPHPLKTPKKTVHFSEENIHDFAWFCSDKYYINKDSVFTPNENKKVITWAVYTDKNYFTWKKATKYINAGILYYSKWVGDYPFNNCTAVEGALSAGGGMEYPTITVVSAKEIESVIVHEVGHNWFYGMLGFNERRYPYLDEGINTFYDHRYSYEIKKQNPFYNYGFQTKNNKFSNPKAVSQLAYIVPASFDMDQPLNLHSLDYSKITYGTIVYEKMPEALIYLENYLGRENFDKIMQTFFEKNKNTHPTPKDFEDHFRNSTNKNLDWFFDGLVATNGKIDYKIKFRNNKVIIKKKGDITAPVTLVTFDKNKKPVDTLWLDDFDKKIKLNYSKDDYSKFIIDPYFQTLDFNRYNNFTRTKGIFKRYEKFKPKLAVSVMDYYSANINLFPIVYYNRMSKFQMGALITNIKIPVKQFTFMAMPLYSFGYKKLEGAFYMQYKIYGHNSFPSTTFSFDIKRFAYSYKNKDFMPSSFKKLKFKVTFDLQNPKASSLYLKQLSLAFSMIPNSVFSKSSAFPDNYATIYNINYLLQKKSKFHPFLFRLNLDFYNETYSLWAEIKYKIHYTSFNDGLEIRLFSGSNVPVNGTYGVTDFKYDHFYWDRYKDYEDADSKLFSHQFVDEYTGLSYYYNSPDYFFVNALNIKTTLPKIPILKFYYNLVSSADLVHGLGLNALDFKKGIFETGIMLDIIPNIFSVYFPLYGSKELMDYNKAIKKNWYQHFRFTFKIENIQEFISTL